MQIAEVSPSIHSPIHLTASRREKPNLSVSLAQTQEEILASLRLRYQVFAGEMGARLHCAEPGVDRDEFDAYCNHLIVKDGGEVVASTRILTGSQAKKLGRFYSETEFDMGKIRALRGKIMEIGRTCVHPDYRGGAAISVLWNGLAQFMVANRFDYLIGCASIPAMPGLRQMVDGLAGKYLSDAKLRVTPRLEVPEAVMGSTGQPATALPPLLKAYVRLGAQVCGEPCWDEDFQVADVFILLDRKVLDSRYARHFVDRADAASSLASFKLRRFHGPRRPAGAPAWLRQITRRLAAPFRSGQAAPG